MVRKKALPYFPSKRNRGFTAAFLKKISKPSVTTRPSYSATCWRFSVFLRNHINPQLFGNLSLSMMMVYKAIPNTMPFLFPELAEDMVEFQINALLDAMQRAKESGNRVKEDVQK